MKESIVYEQEISERFTNSFTKLSRKRLESVIVIAGLKLIKELITFALVKTQEGELFTSYELFTLWISELKTFLAEPLAIP